MQRKRVPILLSFYGLSNGRQNLFFGKLAYSPVADLTFRNYSWLKTFLTIVALYRTKGIRHRGFELVFDHGTVQGTTDASGSFWCEVTMDERQTKLIAVNLTSPAEAVSLTDDLYPNRIHSIKAKTLVISDLDDTLIHSFITNKFKQLRTLLFTRVEKRKAVITMSNLIKRFANAGADPFYLSNSEQNLYPMLYRFLAINEFPPGPLFLKQFIRLRHLVIHKLFGGKGSHKLTLLEKIAELFPDKKMVLIGDNTQRDVAVYTEIAMRYPEKVAYIIIREVHKSPAHLKLLKDAEDILRKHNIGFHHDEEFPDALIRDMF